MRKWLRSSNGSADSEILIIGALMTLVICLLLPHGSSRSTVSSTSYESSYTSETASSHESIQSGMETWSAEDWATALEPLRVLAYWRGKRIEEIYARLGTPDGVYDSGQTFVWCDKPDLYAFKYAHGGLWQSGSKWGVIARTTKDKTIQSLSYPPDGNFPYYVREMLAEGSKQR